MSQRLQRYTILHPFERVPSYIESHADDVAMAILQVHDTVANRVVSVVLVL
jgi:hypothetical protein